MASEKESSSSVTQAHLPVSQSLVRPDDSAHIGQEVQQQPSMPGEEKHSVQYNPFL